MSPASYFQVLLKRVHSDDYLAVEQTTMHYTAKIRKERRAEQQIQSPTTTTAMEHTTCLQQTKMAFPAAVKQHF